MEQRDAIVSEGEFKCNFVGRLLPQNDKDVFLSSAPSSIKFDDDVYDIQIQQFSHFNAWDEKEIHINNDYDLLKEIVLPEKYSFHSNVRDLIYHFILNDQKRTNEFVDQLLILSPTIQVYDHNLGEDEIYGVMHGKAVCLMLKPIPPPPLPPPTLPEALASPSVPTLPALTPPPPPQGDGCLSKFSNPTDPEGCLGTPLLGCLGGCLSSLLFRLFAFIFSLILLTYLIAILLGLLGSAVPIVDEEPQMEELEQGTYDTESDSDQSALKDQNQRSDTILGAEPVNINRSAMGLDVGFVMLHLWDSDVIDADTIDIYFNDILIEENFELASKKKYVKISNYILNDINTLIIYAKSQGKAGLASVRYSFCAECEIIDGECRSDDFVANLLVNQIAMHHIYIRGDDFCQIKDDLMEQK